jgi:hypothetical protein
MLHKLGLESGDHSVVKASQSINNSSCCIDAMVTQTVNFDDFILLSLEELLDQVDIERNGSQRAYVDNVGLSLTSSSSSKNLL